nr:PREDICTED: zinc finger protein 470-like isoform X2 [Latimeria chalumnae]|eukprot:XP_014343981.1 PREDICTED: zinc finger protein 470-like isoform X2 [Latimeria chalumnae]
MSTEQEQTLKALLEDESKAKSVYQRNRNEDNYLFCEDCQEYFLDACLVHGPPVFVVDNPIALGTPSRAFYTIPYGLAVGPSGNWEEGLGVWCTITTIPKGVFFGPLEGDVASGDEFSNIYTKSVKSGSVNNLSFSESKCNWMRFVNYSKTAEGRNLAICRHRGKIYYRVCRPIEPAEELLIWLGGVTCGDQQQQLFETYSQTDNGIPVRIVKQDQDNSCETEKSPFGVTNETGQTIDKWQPQEDGRVSIKEERDWEYHEPVPRQILHGSSCPERSPVHKASPYFEELKNSTEKMAQGTLQYSFRSKSSNDSECSKSSVYQTSQESAKSDLEASARRNLNVNLEGKKQMACEYCGKAFILRARLTVHKRTHTGEKPFPCKLCGKHFAQKTNLNEHMRIHTKERPYMCYICNKSFTRSSHLKIHFRSHTGERPYKCHKCNKAFTDSTSLRKHKLLHSGAHKNKHKVIDSEKNKARKGKACSRSSAVVLPLLGVKKKGDCGVFEGNLDFAEFGSTSLGKTVLTNECNRSGPKKSLINSIVNKNLEHSNDTALGAEQNPFSAESSANAVKSNKSVSIPACAPFCEPLHFGKGKHFECKYCGRIFSRKERLKNHMHTHTGERPYTCKECGKAFSTKSNLNVHLRIHTGNRPYICCFCGKGFYRGPHLKVHIRCHTGEKPYECNHCGKRFADSSTLQKHRKSISGCIKPKPVIQTVEPDLSFAQENNLITSTQKHYEEAMRIYEGSVDTNIQDISTSSPDGIPDHYFSEVSSKNVTMLNTNCFQHMQDETSIFGSPELKISQTSSQTLQDSHKAAVIDCKIKERSARLNLDTPSERKGFKCERCSKTFSRKQFLIQHARTHTGEKPYACSVCGKAFSEKSNMNEHLRTHTGERPYVCSFCGKGFYRSSHLKVHIRCHTGEKPYKCDRCDRTFADCSTLRRHKKSISACPKTQSTSKEPEITNDAKNERYKGCHGASETEEHESNISAQQESTWSEYQLISMNGRYVKNNCIKTE